MFQPPKVDLEAAAQAEPQYLILKARARRVSTATTVCLFLTALLVMSIGIIGGVYLYRQFARSQVSRHSC
jgi:integral membrane protein 2B